ncbi:hypothetical protein KIN34_05035 [Cellulomonas sp. DKR-3]|uniref:Uncharacterized protein n=1 Tax=Cellulomonas fulva TaxID=2835530 RepID=A0ABS5TWW0_9CELL|nr:hypothetical protein [Cellulomonas fulva]MBT0993649.1 hypothetical protein [Cellulomonas fulva]
MDVALPPVLDGRSVLALPTGGPDVLALASAWFADAAWLREPVAARTSTERPMTGARFRGMVVEDAVAAQPGELRLTGASTLVGPHPLDADATRASGLRVAGPLALYALAGEETAQVRGWCVAAARHAAGAVVPAQRAQAVVPDPAAAVDLTLWSPVPLAPAEVLAVVRPAMVGARVQPTELPTPAGGGPQPCGVTATFDYDGEVTLSSGRPLDAPLVLSTLGWREYGPWAYRVTWRSPDEAADSPLAAIARQRVAPTLARVVAALLRSAGGTVVDAGGFVVAPDELDRRSAARR